MQDDFSLTATRVKLLTAGMEPNEANFWRQAFAGARQCESISQVEDLEPTEGDLVVLCGGARHEQGGQFVLENLSNAGAKILMSSSGSETLTTTDLTFAGLGDITPLGEGEWYLSPGSPLREVGIGAELAVNGQFSELEPSSGEVLASISVGYRHRAAIVRRGPITTAGIVPGASPTNYAELGRWIRRAVLSPLPGARAAYRVGIVGYGSYGGMGHYHGVAISDTPGLELTAIAEPNAERRELALREFPEARAHGDGHALAQDNSVDVVLIATPPSTHFDLAKAAISAGKHVVLEKPMCLTTNEADALMHLAHQHNTVLTIHQNRRFDPDFVALKELVDSGELGSVFNIETFVGGFEHPCRAWHSEESISGGAAYDWGSHHIDWILQLYGASPTELFVQSHKRIWKDVTNLDQIRIRMAFEDGREAEFVQSDVAGVRRPKFYVQGTAGTAIAYYEPVVKAEVEFPFGFTQTEYHHAEAPVTFTVSLYRGPDSNRTVIIGPKKLAPFGFHQNLRDHLAFGDPLAVTAESVRPVIEVLEVAHNLSTHDERYAKL